MTDPITDMLNRIRNAQAVLHETVIIPFSKFKYEIAKILQKQGFVEEIEKKGRQTEKFFKMTLKYSKDKEPGISGLKRISKPGQRIYAGAKNIKSVGRGHGIAIVSTPEGLMIDREARKKKLGGEIICEVW